MKVWVFYHHSYGETTIFSEDSDMLKAPQVVSELDMFKEEYPDEVEVFVDDYNRAKKRGKGYATIEERFSLELVEVEEV